MIFKLIGKTIGLGLVVGSAAAGNWLGNQIRGDQTPLVEQHEVQGQDVTTFNIRVTNIVPALVASLFTGRPRTAWAFVAGAVSSALLGQTYEQQVIDRIKSATS